MFPNVLKTTKTGEDGKIRGRRLKERQDGKVRERNDRLKRKLHCRIELRNGKRMMR